MERKIFLRFSLLTSFALLTITSTQVTMARDRDLPEQIDEHYRNYNYVSLFSSDLEKELIADSLMCEGTLESSSPSELDFCSEIPVIPSSQRLDKIRTLIVDLSEDVIRSTHSISVQEYIPGEGAHLRNINPEMQPYTRNPYAPRSELLKINQQTEVDSHSVTVEVTVYQLEPATHTELISHYETFADSGEESLSTEALFQLAAPSSILRREFHQWIREDGTWKRSEISAVLLEGSL